MGAIAGMARSSKTLFHRHLKHFDNQRTLLRRNLFCLLQLFAHFEPLPFEGLDY